MRLFILGQEIELKSGGNLAQTKQANDINNIATRQTNYTNSFSIPRTAKNIRTFDGLGIIGNNSNLPYQKNIASLFSDAGECFVFEGWATISETTQDYKCNIYDGNLEIYKAIENKTLSDLDLSELSHEKTPSEVLSTFNNSKPYKYILADYNGNSMYDINKINIDYLIPSVRISWLINQIESYSGFTLNGSFKTNADYLNLFMTYPKGTPAETSTTLIFDYENLPLTPNKGLTRINDTNFQATKQISIRATANDTLTFTNKGELVNHNTYVTVNDVPNFDQLIVLNIGDVLGVTIQIFGVYDLQEGTYWLDKIELYNSLSIDFLEELKGFTVKDFLNEIVWRFGLTLFKDKYDKIYSLKTISEITNLSNTIDWSDRFVSKESEKYIFGSYAQNNYFRYKYNDDNSNHNDGFLSIDNKNLDDLKTVIQSKIYSPELSSTNILGFSSKVYKLWDKEPKDDGTTTYKPLANRFYFMRSIDVNFDAPFAIGSSALQASQNITFAPVESFTGLIFSEVINKYYSDLKKILNKSQVINVSLLLKDSDVYDVDFSIPYYFKQLGGSFMLNKISNFVPNKKTTVELIRLNNL